VSGLGGCSIGVDGVISRPNLLVDRWAFWRYPASLYFVYESRGRSIFVSGCEVVPFEERNKGSLHYKIY
jgi:hypothetical protein